MANIGGSRGDRLGNSNHLKSSFASPEKVRELLSEGVSLPEIGSNRWRFKLPVYFLGRKSKLTVADWVSHLA